MGFLVHTTRYMDVARAKCVLRTTKYGDTGLLRWRRQRWKNSTQTDKHSITDINTSEYHAPCGGRNATYAYSCCSYFCFSSYSKAAADDVDVDDEEGWGCSDGFDDVVDDDAAFNMHKYTHKLIFSSSRSPLSFALPHLASQLVPFNMHTHHITTCNKQK